MPILKKLIKAKSTFTTTGSTWDNRTNLSEVFYREVIQPLEGTRIGRQEIEAEVIDDLPGALWTRAMIDRAREPRKLPDFNRVIVAVDPSGARTMADNAASSIGIVVAARGVDGRGYILADRSCKMSPAGWGRRACDAYHEFKADRLVAERNFGGAMVEHVIKTTDPNVGFKEVVASRGKVQRAEPISTLYEKDMVTHVAPDMLELEDQQCMMATDGFMGEGSPDRVDALVWSLSELLVSGSTYDHSLSERRELIAIANFANLPPNACLPSAASVSARSLASSTSSLETATAAPALASSRAVAQPMPRVAPVTTATLPLRSNSGFTFKRAGPAPPTPSDSLCE